MLWKIVLIAVVLVVFAIPVIPTKERPEPINLGLDLKGGIRLKMRVNTGDAVRLETDSAMNAYAQQLQKLSLPAAQMRRTADDRFVVVPPAGVDAGQYEKAGTDWLAQFDADRSAEGITFTMKGPSAAAIADDTVEQAIETIRNRVDALGVVEPVIAREGGDRGNRIVIQLPGVDDPARVKEIIRTTAQLQFRIVEAGPGSDPNAVLASVPEPNRANVDVLPADARDEFGRVTGREFYAVSKQIPVTGRDLKTARPSKGDLNRDIIEFSFNPEGGRKFGQLTGANVGRALAIVLDDKVQSAPRIESQIDDNGIIQGSFTAQEAADLALVLRSGSLPASLTPLEERTVGPSLGRDSIFAGVTASIVGFILVVIAVIVYYKGAGLNATVALVLNLLIVLGCMAYFNASLTLPGIAGLILTLAMAIDSNVLVFERIREELAAGRSIPAAIEQGFSLAFGTIIDTHMTTVISALFLFQFGSGPVKGFAVTLLIGLAASVFTAFFVSRVIFDLVYNRPNHRPERISI
jgi:preprotein translocase subunit SecD